MTDTKKIDEIAISIHVPRVEDDDGRQFWQVRVQISIHVPRVEDDRSERQSQMTKSRFQSTSPVWRTTYSYILYWYKKPISIHVPRVEDDNLVFFCPHLRFVFQSTSPVWRTTLLAIYFANLSNRFQSTSPVWRTTYANQLLYLGHIISIHVPRVEDDFYNHFHSIRIQSFQSTSPVWRTTSIIIFIPFVFSHFNPRPPCGGRRRRCFIALSVSLFQSTSPVWRTTYREEKVCP